MEENKRSNVKELSESKDKVNLRYSRTLKGLITNLYSAMRRRARNYNRELLSKTEFLNWIEYDKLNGLYSEYVSHGYMKDYKPSIDRISNNGGYTLDNIQLMTWRDNYLKSRNDIKKRVIKKDKNGNTIGIYNSLTDAAKEHKIANSCISRVCNGERKSSLNFKWEYERL